MNLTHTKKGEHSEAKKKKRKVFHLILLNMTPVGYSNNNGLHFRQYNFVGVGVDVGVGGGSEGYDCCD